MASGPFSASGALRHVGTSNDQTRRHNLSALLTIVHQQGPRSRAQITAHTRLNRSTIAALVAELEGLGLVSEGPPAGTNQVGRPSPVVSPTEHAVAIAVNPEIDAITIGVVGLNGSVQRRIRYETEHRPSVREAVNISAAVIDGMRGELERDYQVAGIGIAVPGLVRAADGLVRFAPHLEWVDEPITRLLAEATGYPVQAANDASLGANAERLFGAGRGLDDLVYLNGGASGIGGGLIVGGRPLSGADGYAGEWGHVSITTPDGAAGALEQQVNQSRLLQVLQQPGGDAEQLRQALLSATDPAVHAEVRRQLEVLSIALGNAVNVLNPQLVILGGFLAALRAVDPGFLDERVAAQALQAPMESVRIAEAGLGADLLLIGAAELAFAPLLADPAGFFRKG